MNDHTRTVIQSTFEASNTGRMHVGDLIARLTHVQAESCHADYRSGSPGAT